MLGDMAVVPREEYAAFVKLAESEGAESKPVSTESRHPSVTSMSAMQTVKDGVVTAQAVYVQYLPPRYEVRKKKYGVGG